MLDLFPENQPTQTDERDDDRRPVVSFDDLADSVNEALASVGSERDMGILALRFGLEDGRKRTLRVVGEELGITHERVRQIQSSAMDRLRRAVRTRPLRIRDRADELKSWGEFVGARLEDPGFARALSNMSGSDPLITLAHLRFLRELRIVPKDERKPPTAVDSRVIGVFAGSATPVSLDALNSEIRSDPAARRALRDWQKMDLPLRLKLIHDVRIDADGMCAATEKTFSDLKRRERRLFALVRVLDEAQNPMHFTEIAQRAKPLLTGRFAMSERNVHAWLDRYKDRFNWAGPGMYGLTEWDVGARTNELDAALGPARRKGVGDEIALLLWERGEPLRMREIERHILEVREFRVNRASVSASVAQDKATRFTVLEDGRVALSRWRDDKRIAAD